MSIYNIPYFYIIRHIKTGVKYAGCRYNKKCNPNDLLKTYFTSSKPVNRIIKNEGVNSFEIVEIIPEYELRIPFGWEHVHDYETWFLKSNDCRNSKHWFNNHNNEGGRTPYNVAKGYATYFVHNSNEHIYLQVEFAKQMGYVSIKSGNNHHFYCKHFSCPDGHHKGVKNGMYGKKNKSLSERNSDPIKAAENGVKYSNFILNSHLSYFNITLADLQTFINDDRIIGLAKYSKNKPVIVEFMTGLLVVQSTISFNRFVRLLALYNRMLTRKTI